MVIMFIVLWTLSAFFILKDFKNNFMRWVSLTAFVGGCGSFGRALKETFVPYLLKYSFISPDSIIIFQYIYAFCTIININFLPFLFLVVCIKYEKRVLNFYTKLILVIPPFLSIITILNEPVFPKPKYNYFLLDIWVVPYIVYGFYILLKIYFKESNPMAKQNHAITLLICSPVLLQFSTVYILRLFGYEELFRFNAVFFVIILPFIIYFLFNSSIFGIRLRLENKMLNKSIRVISSGSEILNHALKNQILLISACSSIMKNDFIKSNISVPTEILTIEKSSKHILEMVQRIKSHSQEIIIVYSDCKLKEIIEGVLFSLNNLIIEKNITVELSCDEEASLYCDRIHMIEVLHNIITNSIDAIENNGVIKIFISENKNFKYISIIDNGKGINKSDLAKIFEPFFSTKKLTLHFGLGLTYCHQVMQKHNGFIYVKSYQNKGTKVFLNFPKHKPNFHTI